MEKRNPKIDAEYTRIVERENNNDLQITRDAESRFMITTFSGDHEDLPRAFRRNMSIADLDRYTEGDRLVLRDNHVDKLNQKIEELEVVAGDNRQQLELDLDEMNEDEIHCPLCGDIIWGFGDRQDFVSCDNCRVYFDFYIKGEQTVVEFGP